jgi:hypothetical protein
MNFVQIHENIRERVMVSKRIADKLLARFQRDGWKVETVEESNNGRSYFITFIASAAKFDKKLGKFVPMKTFL